MMCGTHQRKVCLPIYSDKITGLAFLRSYSEDHDVDLSFPWTSNDHPEVMTKGVLLPFLEITYQFYFEMKVFLSTLCEIIYVKNQRQNHHD